MKIGIAGGIGSGKSYICGLLAKRGIEVYDCDRAAKRLMLSSEHIRRQLTDLIGPDTYICPKPSPSADNASECIVLNKQAVARFLLASEENARAIDAIVHPAVFSDFLTSGLQWMESALMYESGIFKLVDRVVAVTAPEEVRIARIMARDGISREKACEWLRRQLPQDEVRRRADYEIVNDGTTDLTIQIDSLIAKLQSIQDPPSTLLDPEAPEIPEAPEVPTVP